MCRKVLFLLFSAIVASAPLKAATLTVDFALPEFDVANYNRPYVAMWIEEKSSNQTLLLWHYTRSDDDKWLVDIRRWWRKLGRYGDTPDGITSATKGPGNYSETFTLPDVNAFTFYIEVVREDGGRTLLKQPVDLSQPKQTFHFDADNELASMTLTIGKQ